VWSPQRDLQTPRSENHELDGLVHQTMGAWTDNWIAPRNLAAGSRLFNSPIRDSMTSDTSIPPAPVRSHSPTQLEGQWNLPNQITVTRLGLAVISMILIDQRAWLWACLAFVVAAGTDFLDGLIARRYGLVTVLGRVLDPLVDKLLVGGAFAFLAAVPESGVHPWFAVVVIARELLVTTLRGLLEACGQDFSAAWSGKVKMALQCVAVAVVLLTLAQSPPWGELWQDALRRIRPWVLWGMTLATIYSGGVYVVRAMRLIESNRGA